MSHGWDRRQSLFLSSAQRHFKGFYIRHKGAFGREISINSAFRDHRGRTSFTMMQRLHIEEQQRQSIMKLFQKLKKAVENIKVLAQSEDQVTDPLEVCSNKV